jgi:hypothetical protein
MPVLLPFCQHLSLNPPGSNPSLESESAESESAESAKSDAFLKHDFAYFLTKKLKTARSANLPAISQ